MAKNFKRFLSATLAVLMILGVPGMAVLAEEIFDNGNVWYGDQVSVDVTAGENGYNYMALFRPYVHGYEFGGHFMGEGEGPQTFVLLDTVAHDNTTWTPSGTYVHGESNYEVVYCCDVETMIADGTYYKRVNLEDSDYYTDAEAAKIRAILTNAYPYVSLEAMKASLAENGVEFAEELTRNEIIAAVQTAVWCSANDVEAEDLRYQKSYKVSDNLQWGYPMHDTSNEPGLDVSGKRVFKTYEEVGKRIDGLVDYLLALDSVKPAAEQIVITQLDILNSSISDARNGLYDLTINVKLNNSGSTDADDIKINVLVDGETVSEQAVKLGKDTYQFKFQAKAGQTIKAVVSGTQVLPEGVYFYDPEGGRDVSQSLVGVAAGKTEIHAEAEAVIRDGKLIEKTSTKLYEDKFADVTLKVDGDLEYSAGSTVDIVIALGAGIANKTNTYESILTLVEPLLEKGINVKLGFIAVEHYDDVAMELTLLDENYKQIISDGLDTIKTMPAGPTNLHGNIVAAKAMLDADVDVPAENKFFYVVGTGRTYNFDNADGVPTTIINTVDLKGNTYYYWGHYLWQSQRGAHTSLYRVPTSYNNDWDAYWADVEKWVEADGDKYAFSFTDYYDPADPQWFNVFYGANNSDAKAMGLGSSRLGWILKDLTNSGLPAIGSGSNPANALNYERAQYEAYYAYKSMVDAGYTCQALCSESVNYQNYSPYMTVQGVTPSIQLGHSFMDHMAKLSGQEASTVLFNLVDENGNYVMAENFFQPINTDGLSGEVKAPFVEDFIGFGDDYDFDFTGNLDKLVLVVGDTVYTTAKIEAMNGADASYAFTAPGATKATFTVDYFKGNGTTEERFVWSFLEPLKAGTPVSLTYQLELVERNEQIGTHVAETNQSATLYPEGDRDYGQLFPVPEVTYVNIPPLEADKKSEKLEGNRFNVSIEVPGAGMEKKHDEIILMVDGSYSGDKEWPAMKEAITAIGASFLNGRGDTQLTLMAFGMGDNIVLEHVQTVDALIAALGELPGYLLRGVSSTNCEAGFTGVAEYLEKHDGSLKDAIVIYITDGGINTDETPRLFYNWQSYAPSIANVIKYALAGVSSEGMENATEEEKIAFVNDLWAAVFAHSGMDINGEYPISEMERAFLQYDEDNGTNASYSFLIAMKNSKFDKYPDVWNRTYESVFDLAQVSKVKDLYLVRYQNDGRATWMPEAAAVSDSDHIHYVKSDSITTLVDALADTFTELSKTPYNDVVITDYMSKWVNIDLDTLKIVDNRTGEVIWTVVDGWLITEGRPTAQEVPVIVELVDPADYAAGGADVIGNANGVIYKLTWYVKDGALLRSDNYKLVYEVEADVAEPSYQHGTNYPANGYTDIYYNDFEGNRLSSMIKVPNVKTDKPTSTIVTFDSGSASHICFLYVNKVTDQVIYDYKIDFDDNDTSAVIPAKDGYISVVFIKQAQSGMIWASEAVSADVLADIIAAIKANDKAYKGHDAVAFGEGAHDLTYKNGGKKTKTVTYVFGDGEVDLNTDASVEVAPEVNVPSVEENTDNNGNNKNNNGNNKNKNKNKNK